MPTAIHRQVAACQAGEFPRLLMRMPSGWAVLGNPQIVSGYCLLLPDSVVPHLNALSAEGRRQFLQDMTTLGDAILRVTGALRINYEMLGNLEPALHAHLFPRDDHEPLERRTAPIWLHDWDSAPAFDRKEALPLMQNLRQAVSSLL